MDVNSMRRAGAAAAKSESRREREFYKYYDPIRLLINQDPPFYDVSAPDLALHQPAPGPDKVLTSLCQLAALRLHATRAMIFFFNVQCAYILAESTQTSSLQDAASAKDHLWLGFATIPRNQSICDRTIRLSQAAPGVPALNIINDLREDEASCTLPYVAGAPHTRFYAGVPITTARGINIGAFCVLDNEPRAGLDVSGQTFLREMSVTIMSHLEALRGSSAHQRDVRMIAGLDQFVEGSSTQRTEREKQKHPGGANASRKAPPKETKPLRRRASNESRQRATENGRRQDSPLRSAASNPNCSSPEVTQEQASTAVESSQVPPPHPASRPSHPAEEGTMPDELYDNIMPAIVRSTFQRAAELLCEAIEVDQITFLDASVGSFGGMVNSSEDASGSSVGSRAMGIALSDDPISFPHHARDSSKVCRILGEATGNVATTSTSTTSPDVTERFLAGLLRRYPRGRSFTLDDLDATSSDDALRTTQVTDFGRGRGNHANESSGDDVSSPAKQYRKQGRHRDLEHLRRLYPDARSLAISPLWDHTRGRWFAACVLWTSSPSRVFAAELELGFVDAFCDVVMAEVHRVEVERSDKAKTDFISSISHELRSPLHGILGSAEMLREQSMDEFSESMVEQISSCGSNLLDIIDNLLDYSDINFNSKNRRNIRRTDSQDGQSSDSASRRPTTTLMSSSNDIAIDQITEEAVDACVSAHYFSRKPDSAQRVVTILDIEKAPSKCKIAIGGWKRVCVNLVTNALKYTPKGHIYISMRTQPFGPSGTKRFNVILTVADSGKGMSQDFARNGLLQAFKQEDSLTEGTGLGMHLVARIVKAFGGQIEVRTDQNGGGTRITITVPLDASNPSYESGEDLSRVPPDLPEQDEQLKIGFIRWEVSESTSPGAHDRPQSLQLDALKNTCHREGFETMEMDQHTIMGPTQVNIITEMDLPHLLDHDHQDRLILDAVAESKPLIVLCESAKSQLELKKALQVAVPDKSIGYLLQPAGPKRLRRALQSVLVSTAPSPNASTSTLASSSRNISPATGTRENATPDPQQTNSLRHNIVLNMDRSSTPRLQRNTTPQHLTDKPPPPTSPKPPNHTITLMVVEDNRVNQRLLVMYARRRHYQVLVANDGKEALELYTRAFKPFPSSHPPSPATLKPDAILMDINMPVMDGFSSMRAIRAFERRQGLAPATIFALTGLGSADAQREAFTSGCDHFLTKPVHFAELAKLLEKDGLDSGT